MQKVHHIQQPATAIVINQHCYAQIVKAVNYAAVFRHGLELLKVHPVFFPIQLELVSPVAGDPGRHIAYKPGAALLFQQLIPADAQRRKPVNKAELWLTLLPVPVFYQQQGPAAPLQLG